MVSKKQAICLWLPENHLVIFTIHMLFCFSPCWLYTAWAFWSIEFMNARAKSLLRQELQDVEAAHIFYHRQCSETGSAEAVVFSASLILSHRKTYTKMDNMSWSVKELLHNVVIIVMWFKLILAFSRIAPSLREEESMAESNCHIKSLPN